MLKSPSRNMLGESTKLSTWLRWRYMLTTVVRNGPYRLESWYSDLVVFYSFNSRASDMHNVLYFIASLIWWCRFSFKNSSLLHKLSSTVSFCSCFFNRVLAWQKLRSLTNLLLGGETADAAVHTGSCLPTRLQNKSIPNAVFKKRQKVWVCVQDDHHPQALITWWFI